MSKESDYSCEETIRISLLFKCTYKKYMEVLIIAGSLCLVQLSHVVFVNRKVELSSFTCLL